MLAIGTFAGLVASLAALSCYLSYGARPWVSLPLSIAPALGMALGLGYVGVSTAGAAVPAAAFFIVFAAPALVLGVLVALVWRETPVGRVVRRCFVWAFSGTFLAFLGIGFSQ